MLLVVESIFFAVVAQPGTSMEETVVRFRLLLCSLGLVFTLLVWLTLITLKVRSDYLTGHLRKYDLPRSRFSA